MASTKWNSEVRQLFRETVIRYPHQKLEPETEKAYLQDWRDECERVGFNRFAEGVRRARGYSEFVPMIAKIREFTPEARTEDAKQRREIEDLKRRKLAGEKFYMLADVLRKFCDGVESGKLKGKSERGQIALKDLARHIRATSSKKFADKMLT